MRAKHLKILFIVGVLVVNAIAAFIYIGYPTFRSWQQFAPEPSPLTQTYDLFDLGVADINQDGSLDIFTLNHSARQNLLVANSNGGFQDSLTQGRLDQDHTFANIEDRSTAPIVDAPGLYIYREDFDLYLRSYQTEAVTGRLSLALPVKVKKQKNAIVKTQLDASEAGPTTVEFLLKSGGLIILKGFPEIPHQFNLDPSIPLKSVYIGQNRVHPSQSKFVLMWRDRHSMAWSDINEDGQIDVFIGRGGVRGKIGDLTVDLEDELFIRKQQKFEDQIMDSKLIKKGCPARKSAWVDFNGDGYLDLHVSCGRVGDTQRAYPDLLYQQGADHQFTDVAAQMGLNLPKTGYFTWLDIDNDGDQDLLASQETKLDLYINQENRFVPEPISNTFRKAIKKLEIADFDQDGDFDAYVVTSGQGDNKLLINLDGKYAVKMPTEFGLPINGKDAAWLDYDNDGYLDLYVVSKGIYKQTRSGKFKSTPILKEHWPFLKTWNALLACFDIDSDGDRDLLLAYQQTPSVLQPTPPLRERLINQFKKKDTSKIWQSTLYRNRGSRNHWLTLDLLGDQRNPQAIGARAIVKAGNAVQTRQVGESEGSHYSQGHYRLYFGLGSKPRVDTVEIIWPDGTQQRLQDVVADQRLVVQKKRPKNSGQTG
jgi:hypothetical protein